MDPQSIQRLYQSDPVAQAFFDYAAGRQRNRAEISVERTHSNLSAHGFNRGQIVGLFRALESSGCGRFIVGRHQSRSRFQWAEGIGMLDVARFAVGEVERPEAQAGVDKSAGDGGEWSLSHAFHLREDFEAEFELPIDLTDHEAERLAMFIRAIPMSGE